MVCLRGLDLYDLEDDVGTIEVLSYVAAYRREVEARDDPSNMLTLSRPFLVPAQTILNERVGCNSLLESVSVTIWMIGVEIMF